MTAFTAMKFGPKALIVDKRTLVACAVLGVVSNGIYNMFYTMAIANAGIAVSAVLLNTAPIFTTVFSMWWVARLLQREASLTWKRYQFLELAVALHRGSLTEWQR